MPSKLFCVMNVPSGDKYLQRCPGHDGGRIMARFQKRKCPDLENQLPAYKSLVIDTTLLAVAYKAKHAWTEASFSDYMEGQFRSWTHMLSSPDFKLAADLLPRNYKAALTMLSKQESCIWNNQIHYDMCTVCKFVYRCGAEKADVVSCPCCKVVRKTHKCKLVYMPACGHMRNTFGCRSAAESMGSWWVRRSGDPDKVRDSTDLINPFKYDPTKPISFDNDPRFWMVTHIQDPFAPFKDDMSYSCSPSLLHVLNFPAWIRQKLGYCHVLSVGPGTRKGAMQALPKGVIKTDQHQHNIFADELNYLDRHGVWVHDASTGKPFLCRARLVNTVSDLRGMEKLIGISSVPARYGCLHCWIKGFKIGAKMVYVGHDRWLPKYDPLRELLQHRNKPSYLVGDTPAIKKVKDMKKLVHEYPPPMRTHYDLVTHQPTPSDPPMLIEGEGGVRQHGELLMWMLCC